MENNKKKKILDIIIKVVLVIIIILLLIKNCDLLRKNNEYKNKPIPNGNIDVIDISCDNGGCSQKKIESLDFAQKKVAVKKGNSTSLIVIIKPIELSNSKLTWKSSNPSIVTVDFNGVIKGLKEGTATITVTSSNGKTATCIVEVTKDDVNVKKINFKLDQTSINIGQMVQIYATIEPENATNRDLVWESSDSSIATVDSKGIVKGVKAGTVTITAKTKDGKVTASVTITVNPKTEEFDVYDDAHTPVTWNGSNDLKIFSRSVYTMKNKIAPESSNTYQFVVRNSTSCNLRYEINFIETNNYNINVQYKLKKNDTYIIDHYVKANELVVNNMLLNPDENDTYYLEWKWISSSNDTSIGENAEADYGLKIEIKAEGIDG